MKAALCLCLFAVWIPAADNGDWPAYGRDPGAMRFSPLDQINTTNVSQLQRAWTYHTGERGRAFEATPIMVDNVLYTSTQNEKIVALNPESGKEIWKFDPKANGRENRGVSYWPGDSKTAPRILFGILPTPRLRVTFLKGGRSHEHEKDCPVVDLQSGRRERRGRSQENQFVASSPFSRRVLVSALVLERNGADYHFYYRRDRQGC